MTAEELATALGAKRSGRQWKACCPAHEDGAPSLIIFDGRESVQVRCLAGCDQIDVISALRRRGLWSGGDRPALTHSDVQQSVSRETLRRQRIDHEQIARHLKMAQSIFDDSREIENTLAERYLQHRSLWHEPVRGMSDVRYHARCPRGDERVPALVVAMRAMQGGAFRAVQRIFLTPYGRKDGKLMMLGGVGGAAMMLTPRHEVFRSTLAHCDVLTVVEGFETGLAAQLFGFRNVWALGSAGAIRALPVLYGVDALVICADHDAEVMMGGRKVSPGIEAAEVCQARWQAAGRDVDVRLPGRQGLDLADVWSEQHAG